MPTLNSKSIFWIIFGMLILKSSIAQEENDVERDSPYIHIMTTDHRKSNRQINKQNIDQILQATPASFVTTLLNRENELTTVELTYSESRFTSNHPTVYYSGTIQGISNSLVMISIKENQVSGLVSDNHGNYNLSTSTEGDLVTIKPNVKSARTWSCHELPSHDDQKTSQYSNFKSLSTTNDTIEIYFVCDYELFVLHNFSVQNITSYVHDLFNQVKILYAREEITLSLGDIKIWQTPDPYGDESPAASLLNFRSDLGNNHPGTLAHLLSGNANVEGGTAFTNGLCNRNKSFGYSNVNGAVSGIGVYSWDVHVVAHEIGHNLGSQHTHDCAWGPDGTDAIDACGEPAPECDDAPIPSEGGTIMSYCHTTNVGVNFSLGFGPLPSERMKTTINQCRVGIGETCETAIELVENAQYIIDGISAGNGAFHSQSTHSKWYKFQALEDGTINIWSCGQEVDTRLFVYSGDCLSLNEIANSDDDCYSGNGYNYASQINALIITSGSTIYIEWDDRWSDEAFNFTFDFTSEIELRCTNGVQDGEETGIDCGGPCQPCLATCNDQSPIPQIIDTSTTYKSRNGIIYNGMIRNPGILNISSPLGVEINPEFQILQNGQFEISIGACQ